MMNLIGVLQKDYAGKTKGRPCLDTNPFGAVAKVVLSLKRTQKSDRFCSKISICVHFQCSRRFPSFQVKTFLVGTGKRCADYRTQITSGERYGFAVDTVSSDSRVSYGYGEVEPRWHNRGTETDSPLRCRHPSPSSGCRHRPRGGRTPSRPASPKPPPPRRTPIRTGELIYSWGRRALHQGAQRRIHPMSTFSSPSLPPNRNSEYRTAPGRGGVRVQRGIPRVLGTLHCLARKAGAGITCHRRF